MHTVISRARWLIFVCLTFLFVLALAAPVVGAPPEFQTVMQDVTFVDQNAPDQCGFPVQLHLLATIKISTHDLNNGTVMETDRNLHATVTFTNLATGTSLVELRRLALAIDPSFVLRLYESNLGTFDTNAMLRCLTQGPNKTSTFICRLCDSFCATNWGQHPPHVPRIFHYTR